MSLSLCHPATLKKKLKCLSQTLKERAVMLMRASFYNFTISFCFKLFRNCSIFICFLCCHVNQFFQNTRTYFCVCLFLDLCIAIPKEYSIYSVLRSNNQCYIFSLDDLNGLIRPWLSLGVSNIKWLPSSFLKWPCVVDFASSTLPLRFNSNFLFIFSHIMFLNSVHFSRYQCSSERGYFYLKISRKLTGLSNQCSSHPSSRDWSLTVLQ